MIIAEKLLMSLGCSSQKLAEMNRLADPIIALSRDETHPGPMIRVIARLNLNFSLDTAFDLGFTLPIQGTLQPFFGVMLCGAGSVLCGQGESIKEI
jgi:hypothetical protein